MQPIIPDEFDASRDLARRWRPMVVFGLGMLATALTTAGTIFVSPVVAESISGKPGVLRENALWWGIFFLAAGIVCVPILAREIERRAASVGVNTRFVARIDECIRAMNEFRMGAEHGSEEGADAVAKSTMIQKITTEATQILGNGARVCVYRYVPFEEERDTDERSHLKSYFELERENPGDRHPHSIARRRIIHDNEAGSLFIEAAREKACRIVINNIDNPRVPFDRVRVNRSNGYKSFMVSPIIAPYRGSKPGSVIGAITVDFPKKNIIDREIDAAVASITEMFSFAYSEALGAPFRSQSHEGINSIDFLSEIDKDNDEERGYDGEC